MTGVSFANVIEIETLGAVTGQETDTQAISTLAYARIGGLYDLDMLRHIDDQAQYQASRSEARFLNLRMLRGVHRIIDQVASIMTSVERLAFLSEIVGTPLEPYHIDIARTHINYYDAERQPIDFHADGSALVELIPLPWVAPHDCVGTYIYEGRRDDGLSLLAAGSSHQLLEQCRLIEHRFGESILLQGRRLLHAGAVSSVDRRLLVIAMRSRDQPWKDDNTLSRLALDYEPSEFIDDWVNDEFDRKLPALRAEVGGA